MKKLDRSISLAEVGFCFWHHTDPYKGVRAQLEAELNPHDPDTPLEVDALEFFDALMDAAENDGLTANDYSAPIGDRIDMVNKPWIGELKATGLSRKDEGGPREYRLYFAEPELDAALLASFLGHKTHVEMNQTVGGSATPRSSGKQTAHITTAMTITKRWCTHAGVLYRLLT
ncbi:hypothetical protein [Williamsia sp.]|uniref:hypothetical protein n=1 Tax=Williamsia sp. TaxID=1872085 RepID=UPI002F94A343